MMTSTGTVCGRASAAVRPVHHFAGRHERLLPGRERRRPWRQCDAAKAFIDKVVIKTGSRPACSRARTRASRRRISTVIDPDDEEAGAQPAERDDAAAAVPVRQRDAKQLTNNEDLFPDLTRMVVQRFLVTRADGFNFRTTVYLPSNYKEGHAAAGVLLVLSVASSRRRSSTTAAGGGPPTPSRTTFQNFGSPVQAFLVRLGYAVVEHDAPIVGAAGEMNNNYVDDLRNNLAATIDELDKRAIIDRHRLGIGGHSYGAFSTVNAMVQHAVLQGRHRRRRRLQPHAHAERLPDRAPRPVAGAERISTCRRSCTPNQLTGALLMYHGTEDQNVGTDPINSIRLFHALQGLGKTTSLYMYPYEDHGPIAQGNGARPVGALGGVAGQVREEPGAAQQAGAGRNAEQWQGRRPVTPRKLGSWKFEVRSEERGAEIRPPRSFSDDA